MRQNRGSGNRRGRWQRKQRNKRGETRAYTDFGKGNGVYF